MADFIQNLKTIVDKGDEKGKAKAFTKESAS